MKKLLFYLILFCIGAPSFMEAQIKGYEYWFDDDYTNRSTQTLISPTNNFPLQEMIPTTGIEGGLHQFRIRFLDNAGRWSSLQSILFYKKNQANLVSYEYWFDGDYTNKVSGLTENQSPITFDEDILTSSLSKGLHQLHIRFKDEQGRWSAIQSNAFVNSYPPSKISKFRYWFDDQDVFKKTLAFNQAAELIPLRFGVDSRELADGPHTLHLQFQDTEGKWGSVRSTRFNKGPFDPALVQPYLVISAGSFIAGQGIGIEGYSFRPNASLSIYVNGPRNYQQSLQVVSNSLGYFSTSLNLSNEAQTGNYETIAIEDQDGRVSSTKYFEYTAAPTPSVSRLMLQSPVKEGTKHVNLAIPISWTDILQNNNRFTISGAQIPYSYLIEYSSDDGITWQNYMTVNGQYYPNVPLSLTESIIFQNAGNRYKIRISDLNNPSRTVESENFEIQSAQSGTVEVRKHWDYSYPDITRNGEPLGVAADGTSRIYISVKPLQGSQIQGIDISLSDEDGDIESETLGKLMPASEISAYSTEANGITTLSASNNQLIQGQVWFWYVAPDDFVRNNTDDENKTRREVTANIVVRFQNGTTQPIKEKIIITRPPLMLVHGLGGSSKTWDNFYNDNLRCSCPFIYDPRFTVVRAVDLLDAGGAFDLNAESLISNWQISKEDDFLNSFPGVIYELRKKGIAANQVDYVAHSMGGNVMREIFTNFRNKYERVGASSGLDYKNYGKGYSHKIIIIATPHMGSPIADMAKRYVPDLNFYLSTSIQLAFNRYPESMPFHILKQEDPNAFFPKWKVSEAVKDLRTTEIDFDAIPDDVHLIASDLYPNIPGNPDLIPQEMINELQAFREHLDLFNWILKVALRDNSNPQLKQDLRALKALNKNSVYEALRTLEILANILNIAFFIPESDLVVSVESQLSGLSPNAKNFTMVNKLYHVLFRKRETRSIAIGNRVSELLNSPIGSDLFGPIPASSNKKNSYQNLLDKETLQSSNFKSEIDTSRFKIMSPKIGDSFQANQIMELELVIPDTVGLSSLEVYFQNNSYSLDIQDTLAELFFQVNTDFLDRQTIYTEALYIYPDSVEILFDTLGVNVLTDSELRSFEARPKTFFLLEGEIQFPEYRAIFENFATPFANFSSAINANVEDTSIIGFSEKSKGFYGKAQGETHAIVTYKNLRDTLYFAVSPAPDSSIIDGLDDFFFPNKTNNLFYLGNTPNPFSHKTEIHYELFKAGEVSLELFDIQGHHLQTIEEQNFKVPGEYQIVFEAEKLPPGVYVYKLQVDQMSESKKMVLIR